MGRRFLLLLALVLLPSVMAASLLIPPTGYPNVLKKGDAKTYTFSFKGDETARTVDFFVESMSGLSQIDGERLHKQSISLGVFEEKSVTVSITGVVVGKEDIRYGIIIPTSGMFKQVISDKFSITVNEDGSSTSEPPRCGDGICNNAETCTVCRVDCGECPVTRNNGGGGGGGGGGGVSPYYSNWTRPNRTVYNSTPVQPEISPDLPLPPTTEQSLAGQEASLQDLTPGESALSEMVVDTRTDLTRTPNTVEQEAVDAEEGGRQKASVTWAEISAKKGFIPIVVVFFLLVAFVIATVLTYREVSSW